MNLITRVLNGGMRKHCFVFFTSLLIIGS